MRRLLLTLIFAFSNVAIAQQETVTPSAAVAAAMSRGNIVCTTWIPQLTIAGSVLEDTAPGFVLSYANAPKFTYKFIGQSISNGKISIHGYLVGVSNRSNAKGWFTMTNEVHQNTAHYQRFSYSPIYKANGDIDTKNVGRISMRCTNINEFIQFLPEMTEAQVNQLKSDNLP